MVPSSTSPKLYTGKATVRLTTSSCSASSSRNAMNSRQSSQRCGDRTRPIDYEVESLYLESLSADSTTRCTFCYRGGLMAATRSRPRWMASDTTFTIEWARTSDGSTVRELYQGVRCDECGRAAKHIERINHALDCTQQ